VEQFVSGASVMPTRTQQFGLLILLAALVVYVFIRAF